jgi:RNA polymerase sigma-70 factor (ECF subfamily)
LGVVSADLGEKTPMVRGTMREDEPGLARSFDDFYESTRRELLGQLYLLCGNRQEAEDCLQEAYMRAWAHWAEVSNYDQPAAWVRTVAWRLAVGRWRRLRTRAKHMARAVPARAQPEDVVAVGMALRALPMAQRQALVLHDLWGLTVDEVSQEVGAPPGTIKARLSRGRTALASLLKET